MTTSWSGMDALQLALVRTQVAIAASGERAVIVLEGRDAAGKDGLIKRLTEHLSVRAHPRGRAAQAVGSRDAPSGIFQRYVAHLPAAGELVIFNRSWYNRAGRRGGQRLLDRRRTGAVPARRARFRADAGRERDQAGEAVARHHRRTSRPSGSRRGATIRSRRSRSRRSTQSRRTNGTTIRPRATRCCCATHTRGRAVGVRRDRPQEGRAQSRDPPHPPHASPRRMWRRT